MEEREESQGFYEMLWDCPHCETKGLLGKSQRHCPECGAPQDATKRYFPTPEQQQEVVGHTYEGADRYCPSCNAPQAARAKNCTQCGTPMDGSATEVRGASDAVGAAMASAVHPKGRRIWPFVVGGILLVIGLIWFLFIRHHTGEVAITGHRWERTIAIEEFGDQHREAWRNEVPASASFPVCFRKQRSTRQVPDGEECHTERKDKKDGTFEQVKKCKPKTRSEGIDDDWCTFTVRAWAKVSDAQAKGSGVSPTWPPVPVAADTLATLGARRQGARTEKLTLDFGPDDSCDVADPIWRKYTDGQKAKVEMRARSGGVVCDSL